MCVRFVVQVNPHTEVEVSRVMAAELWNDKTRNAIGEFATEVQALAFVRETINAYGRQAVATWAMDVAEDGPMIRGEELVNRAMHVYA
jgi:hypothetical protein